ncbi:MAG: hypothetical protein KDA59_15820 [Planctomycetales bacterium]|nr:hypothetical protein [Planctomycetales bacterium]
MFVSHFRLATFALATLAGALAFSWQAAAAPIEIAEVKQDEPVDFEKQILPIFRRNCLACHNSTEAESDLVLETPAAIIKGGSIGAGVVPEKSGESLLLKVAAHIEEPIMPPDGNDVGAKNLTPQELGLIKLWIDQGAKGEVLGAGGPVTWQPLPVGVNPIYALSVSPDGQYVAASRANQIFMYHFPSKRELGRLTDTKLLESGVYSKPGVAHLDLVQSLAFNPAGDLLVSGGYRNVKFWRRPQNVHLKDIAGLDSPARSIAVSADQKWLAFGLENGQIKLVDAASGNVAHTMQGHGGPVSGVAFSADGSKLLSGSHDKTHRLWNTADGQAIASVEGPAPVNAVAFISEGKEVATADADNKIRVWALPGSAEKPAEGAEPAAPQPIRELNGHGGPVHSLAVLDAAGTQLVSGSQDATVRVWTVANGQAIRTMNHGGPVVSVAATADGQRVASASDNGSAKLWNATNGQQIAELMGEFRRQLSAEEQDRAVRLAKRLVDLNKADLEAAKKRKEDEEKNAKAAEEALKKAEEEFKQKDEASKKPIADKEAADKELEAAKETATKAEEAKNASAEAATKAAEALKAAQDDQAAKVKAAQDATNAANDAAQKLKAAQDALNNDKENKELADAVTAAQKVADDAEAAKKAAEEAKAAADKAVTEATQKKTDADKAANEANQALTKAQNDQKAAENKVKQAEAPAQKAIDERQAAERNLQASKRSIERSAEAVKKATDEIPNVEATVTKAEEAHKAAEGVAAEAKTAVTESVKPYRSIAFSPNGRLLATGGEGQTVQIWDGETGAAVDSLTGHGAAITCVAFTADTHVVSAAANNQATIWNVLPDWTLERQIGSTESSDEFVDRVTALAISADGELLATGSGEPSRSGQLKIWKISDGSLVREIKEPHSDTIFALEFSRDGQYIASCGADRFVKTFEVSSGNFVRAFEGHTHHVLGVSFSADGRTLASSGADKVIKVWDFRTGDQKRTIQGFGKEVTAVHFIADTDNIVASCGDKNVYVKRADNGGNVRNYGGAADFVYGAAATDDGKYIIGGGQDSVLRIWQENGQTFINFDPPQNDQVAASGAE